MLRKKLDTHITSMGNETQIEQVKKNIAHLESLGSEYSRLCELLHKSIEVSQEVLDIRDAFNKGSVEYSDQINLYGRLKQLSNDVSDLLGESFREFERLLKRGIHPLDKDSKAYMLEDLGKFRYLLTSGVLGFFVDIVENDKDFSAIDKIEPSSILDISELTTYDDITLVLDIVLLLKEHFDQQSVLIKTRTHQIPLEDIGLEVKVESEGPWIIERTREVNIDLYALIIENADRFNLFTVEDKLRERDILNTPDFQSYVLKKLSDDFPGGTIIGDNINLIYISRYTDKSYLEWFRTLTTVIREIVEEQLSPTKVDVEITLNTKDILLITYDQEIQLYDQSKLKSLAREIINFLV